MSQLVPFRQMTLMSLGCEFWQFNLQIVTAKNHQYFSVKSTNRFSVAHLFLLFLIGVGLCMRELKEETRFLA